MKLPSLKSLLKNGALSLASFLLCFLLAEIVFRCLGYGDLEIYQPDPQLYWRLKPNQSCFTKIDHKPVRVNSHGTRGPEFQTNKPAGTIRILSLGDSRTFGWGLSEPETYSVLLEKQLQNQVGAEKKIEIINAGVNAWSYPQMLVYFREYGLKYNPDFVILADANLWTQFSEKNDPAFVKKFMSRVQLKNFLRRFALYHFVVEVQLKGFYEQHRSKFIPVDPKQDALFKEQQQEDPDAFFKQAIEGLCQLAIQQNVKPVLLYQPTADHLEDAHETSAFRAKQQISQRLGVPLVDITPDVQPKGKALYLEADPVHLNAAGNEIIGARLFETMTKFVTP